MNEDRPIMSATELQPIKCTFQRRIDYVDILWRSAARGRQTREVWGKQAIFELNVSVNISKTVRDTFKVTISGYQESTYALSIGTKINDLG